MRQVPNFAAVLQRGRAVISIPRHGALHGSARQSLDRTLMAFSIGEPWLKTCGCGTSSPDGSSGSHGAKRALRGNGVWGECGYGGLLGRARTGPAS